MMRKRRLWRTRAMTAAISLATWPAGKPGRNEVEAETIKCMRKLHQWFRSPKAQAVIIAVQRCAVNAFREQFS